MLAHFARLCVNLAAWLAIAILSSPLQGTWHFFSWHSPKRPYLKVDHQEKPIEGAWQIESSALIVFLMSNYTGYMEICGVN